MTPEQEKLFRARVLPKMQRASAEAIASSADYHVCSTTCYIPGSLKGTCTLCGADVWYADLKSIGLRKICLDCALKIEEFLKGDFLTLRNSVWDGYPEN